MKRLGVFLLSLDEMLFHCRATLSIKFAGIHLYTLAERGMVIAIVKCLAPENNPMVQARLQPGPLVPETSPLAIDIRPSRFPDCMSSKKLNLFFALSAPSVSIQVLHGRLASCWFLT